MGSETSLGLLGATFLFVADAIGLHFYGMLVNEAFADVASFLGLPDLAALLFTNRSTSRTGSSHAEKRLSCHISCAWLPQWTPGGRVAYEFAYTLNAVGENEKVHLPKTALDETTILLLRHCTMGYLSVQCRCGSQYDAGPCVAYAVGNAAGLFVVMGAIHLDISLCAFFSDTNSVIGFLAYFHKFRALMITDKQHKLWSEETSTLADGGGLVAYCEGKGLRSLEYNDWAGTKIRFDLAPAAN